MNVQKFFAATTRDALRKVRDELGPDAIILANKPVPGGVEIMAVAELDVNNIAGRGAPPPAPAPDAQPTRAIQAIVDNKTREARLLVEAEFHAARTPAVEPGLSEPVPAPAPASVPVEPPAARSVTPDEVVQDIVRELRFLRGMVEGQLAGFAWGDMQRRAPHKIEIMKTMLGLGFSPLLSRQLLDHLPEGGDVEYGLKWVRAALTRNINVVPAEEDILEKGGVYALVGPTGVGKTTTVAKLAARATLKYGPARVALITTDSFRIGAHEQLRIYGKILGIPVHAVRGDQDLAQILADVADKHLVLIDTVGMSQRDRKLVEQHTLLSGAGRPMNRLLLLSANGQGATLDEVVRAYQGEGMAGCILTKMDEAVNLGAALDTVIRHKLPLHFITNGQRVPEDLHHSRALYLVDRAFKPLGDVTPFMLKENEFPLAMAEVRSPGEPRRVGAVHG